MHSHVCCCLFLGQEWSKGKHCKIIMLNHKSWVLCKHPHPFCAMIVTDKVRENKNCCTL